MKKDKLEERLYTEYDIDKTRSAIEKDEKHGCVVLEELDINLSENIPFNELFMKKLIAYKLENEKVANRNKRTILGEIDMEVSTNLGAKFVKLDGYAAKDKNIMKLLFQFLENRAIEHGSNSISLNDAFGKEIISFLPELGYTSTPQEKYTYLNVWEKVDLKKHKFTGKIQDIQEEFDASERN